MHDTILLQTESGVEDPRQNVFFQPQVMFSNLGPVQKMDVSQCEQNYLVSTSFSTGVRQGNSVFQDQSNTRSINQNNVVSSIFSSHCCTVCFAALFSLTPPSVAGVWGVMGTKGKVLESSDHRILNVRGKEVFAQSFPSPVFLFSSSFLSTLWTSWARWRV